MSKPIAIVGSACRFPGGVSSPSEFWELLQNPRDVLSEIPRSRLNLNRFYNSNGNHHGATDVQCQGYLLSDDVRNFDASFFKINPREADVMDPQQRILLEVVYETFENAGYSLEAISGTHTSVHVGVMNADYADIQTRDSETIATHHATGTARSILSNRISYFFNLRGPSLTIDTACSSSLVALHSAVQGLRNGEAKAAVVAGANLILDTTMYIAESKLHMLSPDSRSRMWDKDANGYARGEGFAAILLKPLDQAIADGDDIEAVIREIGVNSDGRSPKGITNPSSTAQTDLIRQTYIRAGLDPVLDRCHFFECHGTGTLAGDPVEAKAIRDAFYPISGDRRQVPMQEPDRLFVGSVKTVIGHTEGCAGLAGVLKATLAVKNKTIPPNLLFNELNPEIRPYYDNLEVVVQPQEWVVASSVPMRVSVNSFGFGGTNAHAIIESYISDACTDDHVKACENEDAFIGPLVFSAHSESSLVASVASFADYLRCHPKIDVERLAWTLQTKRSLLGYRTFFSGATRTRLRQFMERFAADPKSSGSAISSPASLHYAATEEPGILGVFTGQGAQWPSFGRGLLLSSPCFRDAIEMCETTLARLPDPPPWSLVAELMSEGSQSRVSEAAICQPLCTAVQIGLVALLRAAGIKLHAVIGHSSGEIAAAYAAGIITAPAAIQISYYRGLYAGLACGKEGKLGRMMAVGISYAEALQFCSNSKFEDRLSVAASNSPGSVTISGDEDAIEEAKAIFDQENTFARLLRTDTAYHSHHMRPCSGLYYNALKACQIQVQPPNAECKWTSSVFDDWDWNDFASLDSQYWVDNMRRPVLFSQALEGSLWHGGPFEVVLELGPHPALKGPAEQTFKAAIGHAPPYAGLMRRGENEVEAFSGAVGFVWRCLGSKSIDFAGYRAAFNLPHAVLAKGLPRYAWDHRSSFWKESRVSRRYRLHDDRHHELLGRRIPDDSDDCRRWRNILRLEEIPWLKGHNFQGQVLFPGAGYLVLALEAALQLAADQPIALIELEDVRLVRAITLSEDSAGVETIFCCNVTEPGHGQDSLMANFTCSFCTDEASRVGPTRACTGRIRIIFQSKRSTVVLPERPAATPDMVRVDVERLRSVMANVGLDYRGLFKGMSSGLRTLGTSNTTASWRKADIGPHYKLHPAILDVAFQGLYAAFASPASGEIWAPYLPVRIERLSLAVQDSFTISSSNTLDIDVSSFVGTASSTLLAGDVHIYDAISQKPLVQVEGLAMQAMSEPAPENDKLMFSETVWTKDILYGLPNSIENYQTANNPALVDAMNRVALYYWRRLFDDIPANELAACKPYHLHMLATAQSAIEASRNGSHPVTRTEWLQDTDKTIEVVTKPYDDRADMQLLHVVGQNLRNVLTTERHMLEFMIQDDLLNRFYVEGLGFSTCNNAICEAVQQIVAKNPHARILEIGAGTGGTTSSIFSSIGQSFKSYTYTDISSGFFASAAQRFAARSHRMIFKVLDIEKDVASQGFEAGSYDIIIAANVLHATKCLEETMQNVRQLLVPGGHLVLMEITGLNSLWTPFIMGPLPGWWAGVEDGRVSTPAVSEMEWDDILRRTAFSGVDFLVHDMEDENRHCFSMVTSQAVNPIIEAIREPLSRLPVVQKPDRIAIIGGKTLATSRLVRDIRTLLTPWVADITVFKDIESIPSLLSQRSLTIISLQELDQPLFAKLPFADSRMKAVQDILKISQTILWVTAGRLTVSPESNMMVGIGRAASSETPGLKIQFLDLEAFDPSSGPARCIAETFLRLNICVNAVSDEQSACLLIEPELVARNGAIYLPRVKENALLNETYNANRRCITKSASPQKESVELKFRTSGVEALVSRSVEPEIDDDLITLQVEHCILLARHRDDHVYLCNGNIEGVDDVAVVLSSSNASRLRVPLNMVFTGCGSLTTQMLASIGAALLITSTIATFTSSTGTIVIHECPELLQPALRMLLADNPSRMVFTTSHDHLSADDCMLIHPTWTSRTLKRRLPHNACGIVDFSTEDFPKFSLLESKSCPLINSRCIVDKLRAHDIDPLRLAATEINVKVGEVEVLPAKTVAEDKFSNLPPCFITRWAGMGTLVAQVQPLETPKLLSGSCTYLLVGMTGEMGLSISRWMAENGASHIAMASRNPKVSAEWLNEMERRNVEVQVFRADVTDNASMSHLQAQIRAKMPRIAGIVNGSMVLSDSLFTDMDVDSLNACLQPKVIGSKILNELFGGEDLQFFLLLSSLATITGNAGQANYHAANMFMASLVSQRRAKGLPASLLHIGLVTDIGYVARRDITLEEHLRGMFFMPISESDLHHAFAEAILAGRPGSDCSPELIIGLEPFVKSEHVSRRPPWEANPRLSCFIRFAQGDQVKQATDQSGPENLKQEVDSAETDDASDAVIRAHFCRKLTSMMQLPSDSINVNIPLIDLGCDSLLAIEIRGWFLGELQVDIPILKVLSGDTTAELCTEASQRYHAARIKSNDGLPAPSIPHNDTEVSTPSHNRLNEEDREYCDQASGQDGDSDSPSAFSASPLMTPLESSEQQCDSVSIADTSVTTLSSLEERMPLDKPRAVIHGKTHPLGHAQSRLWFLSKYLADSRAYNVTVAYDVSGPLNLGRLRAALLALYWRHSSLRTCFFEDEECSPVQAVLSTPLWQPKWVSTGTEDQACQEYQAFQDRKWNLEEGDAFDVTVVSLSAEYHRLIFGYHHIVLDGMSWHIYLRDLVAAYSSVSLPPCLDCHSFSDAMSEAALNGLVDEHVNYWQDLLDPLPEVIPLLSISSCTERKALSRYEHNLASRLVGDHVNQRIRQACKNLRATPFHFHLTVIQIMLFRLFDHSDLCIGIADANRTDEKYVNTVGFFLNLLPLRFAVSPHGSFQHLLRETTKQVLTGLAHSMAPFEAILDALKVPRSSKHSPLFQVAVNYRMGDLTQRRLGDCTLDLHASDDAKNPYDFGFTITERSNNTCLIELSAQHELYSSSAVEMLADMYLQLLDHFAVDTSAKIRECSLHSPDSIQKALVAAKGAAIAFDWPETLSQKFNDIVLKFGQDTAIVDDDGSISYITLQHKILTAAAVISKTNCGSGARVAVLCRPSRVHVVSMLAVLNSGLVYVPLDQRFPRARHQTILQTSNAKLILCDDSTLGAAIELQMAMATNVAVINIETLAEAASEGFSLTHNAHRPAFLLYTSGSTGIPKGILLSQANFRNHIAAKSRMLGIARETILQQSSIGFDMSIIQTFCALMNGGKLVIAPSSSRGDPVELAKLMAASGVTFTIATPTEYIMMLRHGREHLVACQHTWKRACLGGETVTKELIAEFEPFFEHGLRMTNCYGPTEITAAATFAEVIPEEFSRKPSSPGQSVVGKTIPNYSVYILDHHQQLLPCGQVGEICVGGAGVAQGYDGNDTLTRISFLPDFHATANDGCNGSPSSSSMYRTGDKGYLMEDGNLVFMGRMEGSRQVKLNGLRVELDEVAGHFLEAGQGKLTYVDVSARGDPAYLVAFVCVAPDTSLAQNELIRMAQTLPLPPYMIPSVVCQLEKMPLTVNGKIDHKAIAILPLPATYPTPMENERGSHRLTLAEGELRLLWQKVLPRDCPIEPNSDFFLCGGNSLLLVRLQAAIKASMITHISIIDLYAASTLSKMAERVSLGKTQQLQQMQEKIDWSDETAFMDGVFPKRVVATVLHKRKSFGSHVLLTGSTSFLGREILMALLEDTEVSTVHCVAVSTEEQDRLPKSDKVRTCLGSLTSPTLGLSDAELANLAGNLDVIVHAGAAGHCLNRYQSLRTPNVQSTRFLASLAASQGAEFHYVSSGRVTLLSGSNALPPVSIRNDFPPCDGSDGFTASKWASERLLENFSNEMNLTVTIHRACAPVGPHAPSEDALNALLLFSQKLGAVPRLDRFEGFLDFKEAGLIARDIVQNIAIAHSENEHELPSVRFVHHSSGKKLPIGGLRSHMEEIHGTTYEEIAVQEWIDKAITCGLDPLIAGYLEAVVSKEERLRFPFLGSSGLTCLG